MSTETNSKAEYRLIVLGDGSVRTVVLVGDRWVIGRAPDCSIQLVDPTVSRRHLLLERLGDEFCFQDLGGSNQVLLEGRPMRQGTLVPGQMLAIGLTRLVLERRQRPSPLATSNLDTIVLSREVIDEEAAVSAGHGKWRPLPLLATRVLQRIEWTFAGLGDLQQAAEPLLELAMNLAGRRLGWIGRLHDRGEVEPLAALDGTGSGRTAELPAAVLAATRRITQPHLLCTREADRDVQRLIVPLGPGPGGLLVLEDPLAEAPQGQELLQLAAALGKVAWHRLQETIDRLQMRDELRRLRFQGTAAHTTLLASTRLQPARAELRSIAGAGGPVVLVGEDGTEREELARYLHHESLRRSEPFVAWNAARSSPVHHGVELFGTPDGRRGAIAEAGNGTYFIDCAERLDHATQARLVTAIEIGGGLERGQPRLVLATCEPLVAGPTWNESLLSRLGPRYIEIPPLRSDARDILVLAELFLSELGADGRPRLMTRRTKNLLASYRWPGNVLQLRHVIETAASRAGRQAIAPRHLPPEILQDRSEPLDSSISTLEDVERQHIAGVMRRTGGNRARAAKLLGIASSTLYEKLKRYGIEG